MHTTKHYRIEEFITVSPHGLMHSEVNQSIYDPELYYINITWTPSPEQHNLISIFCFSAQSTAG